MQRRHALIALAVQPLSAAAQTIGGRKLGPYVLANTEVHCIPDTKSGRNYEAWIDPPKSYLDPDRRFPVVYVTDAPYAFPLIRSIRARVGQSGRNLEDFVLVGLAPPPDESSAVARLRDYTPTDPRSRARSTDDYAGKSYGNAQAYLEYLASTALPYVESRFRIDSSRRTYIGHSYGGLFGAFSLLMQPELMSAYVLSSPSLWFDRSVAFELEQRRAKSLRDIKADVLMYCGSYETIGSGPRYFKTDDLVRDMHRFASNLRARRYPSLRVKAHVVADEDHYTAFPTVVTRSLLRLLPGSASR